MGEVRAQPTFLETIALVVRAVVQNLRTCLVLGLVPGVLFGLSLSILETTSAAFVEAGADLFAVPWRAFVVSGLGTGAALGSLFVAGLIVYPLAAAGLAWVGVVTVGGGRVGVAEAMRRVAGRGPSAVSAFVAALLAVAAGPTVAALLLLAAAAAFGFPGAAALTVLLVASLFWPAGFYLVRLALAVPAAAAEEVDGLGSLARSNRLVRGAFWWVAGLLGVAALLGGVGGAIISSPFAPLGGTPAWLLGVAGQALGSAVSIAFAGVGAGVVFAVRRSRLRSQEWSRFQPFWDARAG